MRLLILGGTVFLGRAVARLAVASGHHVTCAARGVSGEPVAGARFVQVDRDAPGDLSALDGERFDAVVDVTRRPSHARHAVAALADRAGHWSYVSTCSVYADNATPGQRAATAKLTAPAPVEVDNPVGEHAEFYGPCKVSCEDAVRDGVSPERAFVCRAGLIVGPEDPSDRFPYWVARLARGGEVLAPGTPDDQVQLVDVDDLAQWLLYAAENGLAGTFDGMSAPLPRSRFLAEVAAGVGRPDPELTWVEQDFLVARDIRPWTGERSLPLWMPLPEYGGFLARDVTDSLAAGLRTRPIAQTAARTLEWIRTRPDEVKVGGLRPVQEAEVLREWAARQ
ncbi:NAD-dependent epimerase/dehydratase family protein [Micromonospora sp. NPDC050417]|uniref:NAD-dependent epimerase/dehydratase family protein n=1 Tax=Micromonospora sp. NPDC050417 TaxID=3364280 RepID=UPI0037B68772